jgi:hypothetical protein
MTTEKLLADLAALWVERWLEYGGMLVWNENSNKLQISMRMDWRRAPRGTALWERQQRLWHDGWMVGRWRELGELCSRVPGLREAIIDHVAEKGERWWTGRAMYAAA